MKRVLSALLIFTLLGCSKQVKRNVEAIDDETVYGSAIDERTKVDNIVNASVETKPIESEEVGKDSADDPAIWYNETAPEKSVIFGTNKLKGIHSYTLEGKELHYTDYAPVNNIDVRQGVLLGDRKVDILAGTNRNDNSIDIFLIAPDGSIQAQPNYSIPVGKYKPYGFCLYVSESNRPYAFFNDKYGNVIQISLDLDNTGKIKSSIIHKIKLSSQAEGMVADDKNHLIYIAEEEKGIHVYSTDRGRSTGGKLLKGSTITNENIKFDIEGLALLPPHYLIASSQGNFTYAIFDLEKEDYLTSFYIDEGTVDSVEETDGLEVLSLPLGSDFPDGILVVQDGFNRDNGVLQNQNFKIVNLGAVRALLND